MGVVVTLLGAASLKAAPSAALLPPTLIRERVEAWCGGNGHIVLEAWRKRRCLGRVFQQHRRGAQQRREGHAEAELRQVCRGVRHYRPGGVAAEGLSPTLPRLRREGPALGGLWPP